MQMFSLFAMTQLTSTNGKIQQFQIVFLINTIFTVCIFHHFLT